jgi:hypothetical protein
LTSIEPYSKCQQHDVSSAHISTLIEGLFDVKYHSIFSTHSGCEGTAHLADIGLKQSGNVMYLKRDARRTHLELQMHRSGCVKSVIDRSLRAICTDLSAENPGKDRQGTPIRRHSHVDMHFLFMWFT